MLGSNLSHLRHDHLDFTHLLLELTTEGWNFNEFAAKKFVDTLGHDLFDAQALSFLPALGILSSERRLLQIWVLDLELHMVLKDELRLDDKFRVWGPHLLSFTRDGSASAVFVALKDVQCQSIYLVLAEAHEVASMLMKPSERCWAVPSDE